MLLTAQEIKQFRNLIEAGKIDAVVFDLETSIMLAAVFGKGKQYISESQIIGGTETQIMSAHLMKATDTKAETLVWKSEGESFTDYNVVATLTKRLNKADVVIGQNIRSFDIKVLNERAKVHRLEPVNIDFTIDTLSSSKTSFRLVSHGLNFRSKQYGLGGKRETSLQNWIRILFGEEKVEDVIAPYGEKDCLDNTKMLWKDLPYYQLPSTTIKKIRELIAEHTDKPKLECYQCAKDRQAKFDVKLVEKKTKLQCNNCGTVRKLKKAEMV